MNPPNPEPTIENPVERQSLVVPAAIEAINGYLKNRYLLCEKLANISITRPSRRECIENQINIIDRCVIAVLHAQNKDSPEPIST